MRLHFTERPFPHDPDIPGLRHGAGDRPAAAIPHACALPMQARNAAYRCVHLDGAPVLGVNVAFMIGVSLLMSTIAFTVEVQ